HGRECAASYESALYKRRNDWLARPSEPDLTPLRHQARQRLLDSIKIRNNSQITTHLHIHGFCWAAIHRLFYQVFLTNTGLARNTLNNHRIKLQLAGDRVNHRNTCVRANGDLAAVIQLLK